MKTIDLNADLGEADTREGQNSEAAVLRYISSANIACGGHAGDAETMRRTVQAAKANGVMIGAHPSYPDRESFGRKSMRLGTDIDTGALRTSLIAQITTLTEIAADEGQAVTYVKPHGALYNDAADNAELAELLAKTVAALDPNLIFMGSPGSELETAAKSQNLRFIAEGFIDRRYLDTGRLQPRSIVGAVINNQASRMSQTLSLAKTGTVTSASGAVISVPAQTLCLHGDSAGAVETARQARAVIEAAGFVIKSFSDVS